MYYWSPKFKKPQCCQREYLTTLEEKRQKWCHTATLVITCTCKMPTFTPAVCVARSSGINYFFLVQHQQEELPLLQGQPKEVVMGHHWHIMASTEETKQFPIFQLHEEVPEVHMGKNLRSTVWKSSVSPTTCHFAKHKDLKILSKIIPHRFKTDKITDG